MASTLLIRASRHQASREPSSCSESYTRSLPRLSAPPALSLASPGPRWPCSDRTLSRLCSACCNPIRCASCVCRRGLALECCDCALAPSLTPMQAGRRFAAVSIPSASDSYCDSRSLPRHWRCRMQCRLAPRKSDGRSARQATRRAMNRGPSYSSTHTRRCRLSSPRHIGATYDSP